MSGITRKEVFETADGKTFDTKSAAEIHMLVLDKQAEIQSFIDAVRKVDGSVAFPPTLKNGRTNPQRERASNIISAWLKYEATQADDRSTGVGG